MSHKDDEEIYRNGRYVAYAVHDSDPLNPKEDWDCECEEAYQAYLNGEVYGFVIADTVSGEDHVDSCWGYYGYDHKITGLFDDAKQSADYLAEKEKERYQATIKMPGYRFLAEIASNPF